MEGSPGDAARMNLTEHLVQKRLNNLDYITRIHEGRSDVMWMNVVRLTKSDIEHFYHPQTLQKRVHQWFYLGMSFAPLLQLPGGRRFVRAASQLMEEYEYHFSNVAVQGMKMLKALSTLPSAQDEESLGNNDPIKPYINKVGGVVVYEFLRTPNIPCALDYCEVIFSLCHILKFLYRKLLDQSSAAVHLNESIIKLDGRIKHHFLGLISRDLNTLAMYTIKHQTSSLESLFSSFSTSAPIAVPNKVDSDIPGLSASPSLSSSASESPSSSPPVSLGPSSSPQKMPHTASSPSMLTTAGRQQSRSRNSSATDLFGGAPSIKHT